MSAPTDINELQRLVVEKDELVRVLTERMEMLAEQLDRMRRQGGVFEPAPAAGGLNDPELTDDLKQMVADWRDLQERGWFGSLEDRLIGLHDLVANLDGVPAVERREAPIPQSAPAPSVSEILAKYTASAGDADKSAAEEAPRSEAARNETSESAEESSSVLELPEPPMPVDIDVASPDELREALRVREDYIMRLRDYLVAYDATSSVPIERADLGALTPDQRAAMEAWEGRVRKELRQTQIQLWVERAQLSREQMQMQQLQHQLDTETKRLGMAKQKGVSSKAGSGDAADNQKNKNWLGLFGNK